MDYNLEEDFFEVEIVECENSDEESDNEEEIIQNNGWIDDNLEESKCLKN